MRIVYVNPIGAVGGAERSLVDFLSALRLAEPSLELHLIAGTSGRLLDEVEELGIHGEVIPLPRRLLRLGDSSLMEGGLSRIWKTWHLARHAFFGLSDVRQYVRALNRRFKELSPTLIHSNGIKSHVLTSLARQPGTPLLWHVHDYLTDRPVVAKVLRRLRNRVAMTIANSRDVEADVRKLLPHMPSTTIYYGIDVEAFSPGPYEGEMLDRLAGLPPADGGTVRIGLVATYARWKGHAVFLHAARALCAAQRDLPVRFYIVGGPIYETAGSQYSEAELRGLIAGMGLEKKVGLVPFQHDTASVYRSLDVVVHASTKPEPFGRTIVEAMACGRAVVAVKAGGSAELFRSGEDAVGLALADSESLADALRALIQDGALRGRLGVNARESAKRRFSKDRLAPELLDVYRRLVPAPLLGPLQSHA